MRRFIGSLSCLLVLGCFGPFEPAECYNDADCAGLLVCVEAACVDPGPLRGDAGLSDSGVRPPDSGARPPVDAATPRDAGSGRDATVLDVGSPTDSGPADSGAPSSSCSSTGPTFLYATGGNPTLVSVDWSGDVWGVVWQQWDGRRFVPKFAQVAADGRALATPAFAITMTSTFASTYEPQVVWGASRFHLAYQFVEGRENRRVQYVRLNALGRSVELAGTMVSDAAIDAELESLTWAPTGPLVGWSDIQSSDFYATLVGDNGQPTDLFGGHGEGVMLRHDDGADELVTVSSRWTRDFNTDQLFYVRRGAASEQASVARQLTSGPGESGYADFALAGTRLSVGWVNDADGDREVFFGTVDRAGVFVEGPSRVTDGPEHDKYVRMARNEGGPGFAVVWKRYDDHQSQVRFAWVDSAGRAMAPQLMLSELLHAERPSIASAPGRFGVAFYGDGSAGTGIYFTVVDCRE